MPDLTADELALHLAVMLAAYDKTAPIMRGKKAPRRDERDEVRKAYAKWLAEKMIASNLRVSLGPTGKPHG